MLELKPAFGVLEVILDGMSIGCITPAGFEISLKTLSAADLRQIANKIDELNGIKKKLH